MTLEHIEPRSQEIVRSYLEGASKSQWHIFAARSNYDSNEAPLRWLIDNPETDRATVLMIYWNLGAAWYVQFWSDGECSNPGTFQLLRLIEDRYLSNYYKASEIWFDPHHSVGRKPNDYPDVPVKRPVPEFMLQPVNGTEYVEIESDPDGYDEGLPASVVDALYALHTDTYQR